MSEEVKIKISQPMFEEGELETFDSNIHSIVEEYSKMLFKEKDQILTQRIIIKQEEEIERLNKRIDKATDRIYELLDEYDMEVWEAISYIPLADYWQKMIKEINMKYNTSDFKDDFLEKDMLKQYLFSEINDYD